MEEDDEGPRPTAMISVHVKFKGGIISLSTSPDSTIKHLKTLLQPLTNVLPTDQKLILKGTVLIDTMTLKSLQISDGSKLMLMASHGKESQKKNIGPSNVRGKAQWRKKHHKIWVDLCLELVNNGRRPGTCIDKIGYQYLLKEFNKRTGLNYSRQQLKNHWDKTKSQWQRWNKLVSNTGLGWDPEKGTVVADDEWWANWLQEYPKDKNWREEGLEFTQELDIIFGGAAALQGTLRASNNGPVQPSPSTMDIQDDDSPDMVSETQAQPVLSPVGAENVEDDTVDRTSSRHSRQTPVIGVEPTSKRQKLSGAAKLGRQLNRLCDAIESRSMATSRRYVEGASIKECIELLNQMPEVPRGSKLYLFAVDTFLNKECREAFIALELPEVRLLWLHHKMELATGGTQ
eukprot:TRINITY_DN2318_c0_g4_i1.p1 TRINITY_DN2318_c0_g4~~TRINITY_DN2318_c0_g4_i1.p1  ORF type:complete len:428 (-),score=66.79 TRINITY_DN2318_c0_g4_i1:223-1428(-)